MLAFSGKTPGTVTPSRTANRESLKLRGDVDAATRPVQLLAQKIVEVVATSEARPHVPPKWTMDFEALEVCVCVVGGVEGRRACREGSCRACLDRRRTRSRPILPPLLPFLGGRITTDAATWARHGRSRAGTPSWGARPPATLPSPPRAH